MYKYDLGPYRIVDTNGDGLFDVQSDQIEDLSAQKPASPVLGFVIDDKRYDPQSKYLCRMGSSNGLRFSNEPVFVDRYDPSFVDFLKKYGVNDLENAPLAKVAHQIALNRAEESAQKGNIPVLEGSLDFARSYLGHSDSDFELKAVQLFDQGLNVAVEADIEVAKAYYKNRCFTKAYATLMRAQENAQILGRHWSLEWQKKSFPNLEKFYLDAFLGEIEREAPRTSAAYVNMQLLEGLKFAMDHDLGRDVFTKAGKIYSSKQLQEREDELNSQRVNSTRAIAPLTF